MKCTLLELHEEASPMCTVRDLYLRRGAARDRDGEEQAGEGRSGTGVDAYSDHVT
jgi:hypothetical protein